MSSVSVLRKTACANAERTLKMLLLVQKCIYSELPSGSVFFVTAENTLGKHFFISECFLYVIAPTFHTGGRGQP